MQEEVDLSDLQLFVSIYLEEVQNVETNYKSMMELVERDFVALKKQVLAKLTSTLRQTDTASYL